MTIYDFCVWLEATPLAVSISESETLFPVIETVHVFALTLVFGTIAMLDLRLLGVSSRDKGVMQLSGETLPWTWGAFVVAAISGALLFTSQATKYYENVPLRIKAVLLILAGLNMAIFHFGAYRSVRNWNVSFPTPGAAKVAAGLSILFWMGIVVAGRWAGFV